MIDWMGQEGVAYSHISHWKVRFRQYACENGTRVCDFRKNTVFFEAKYHKVRTVFAAQLQTTRH